ncbi:MAG: beta-ketoacyl-ACP synthase II [Coriobacteriales bacterium]|jgi:3-oxoacyl-[acyl-carrier-protein] synthase II
MNRRVIITGMGAITPLGNTVEESWDAAKRGVNGIGPITQYDTSDMKVKIAGEVKDLDVSKFLDKQEARKLERFTHFALIASQEAIAQSGLAIENEDPYRCGVTISSGIGSLERIERNRDRGNAKGFDRVSPHYIPASITNSAAGNVAIAQGFKGECTCVVSACAGGTNAIGEAMRAIRHGYLDVVLAGGAESCITPLGVGGFTVMRALSETNDVDKASIPFDAEREGFVIAEGAGILVLEELEHAKARGAQILGEVVGYGYTCDAYHITAPSPDGEGAAASMRNAIIDAGIEPSDIDHINAHGTSTPMNEKTESTAIHAVFGDDTPLVSSTKSMTGHMLGGTGAVEAIFSALAIRDGIVPPTINYRTPDPECDVNIVANEAREADLRYVLSDSLGFGGHNASIVLKRYED